MLKCNKTRKNHKTTDKATTKATKKQFSPFKINEKHQNLRQSRKKYHKHESFYLNRHTPTRIHVN